MAMNVRAAVFLSGAFIISLCALVYYNRSPIIEGMAMGGEPDEAMKRAPNAPQRRGLPTMNAPRFAVDSPIESEITNNQSKPRVLTASAPDGDSTKSTQTSLPPLVNHSGMRTPDSRTPSAVSAAEFVNVAPPVTRGAGHDSSADQILLPSGRAAVNPTNDAIASAPEGVTPVETGSSRAYVVKSGDNLAKIAKRELKSNSPAAIAAIVAANPILKGRADKITVGQELRLPNQATAKPDAAILAAAASRNGPRSPERSAAPPESQEVSKEVVTNINQRSASAETGRPTVPSRGTVASASKKSGAKSKPAVVAKANGRAMQTGPGASVASREAGVRSAKRGKTTQAVVDGGGRISGSVARAGLKSLGESAESKGKAVVTNKTPNDAADTIKTVGLAASGPPKRVPGDSRKPTAPQSRSKKPAVAAVSNDRDQTAGLRRVATR